MKKLFPVLTLVLFSFCSAALAQWQWLDKDGRRVFSDRAPPPDVMEKDILKRPNGAMKAPAPIATGSVEAEGGATPNAAAPAKAPLPGGVDKELETKKNQLEKQAADAEAAKRRAEDDRITKAKIENCALAKQGIANLNSGQRMTRTTASGEREVLDDAARATERARIQAVVDSDCK